MAVIRPLIDGFVAAGTGGATRPVGEFVQDAVAGGGGATTDLVIADSSHAQSSASLALSSEHLLSVADSVHAHLADAPVLSADSLLAVAGSLHGHASDTLGLSADSMLAVAGSLHGHSAEGLVLEASGSENLDVAGSVHAHAAAALALSVEDMLAISAVIHAHLSGVPALEEVAGEIGYPNADTAQGAWAASSGTDLFAMLDEESANDADYIYTAAASACTLALSATTDPGTSAGQVLRYRASSTEDSNLIVTLKQGATVIATRTHSVGAGFADYAMALTSEECDAITDYTALSVTLEAEAPGFTVLDSDGNSFTIPFEVLDSDGNSFTIPSTVLDSDGNPFILE